jgi:predicted ATPase
MKARVDFQTGSGRNYYSFELTANNNDELMIWNEMLGYQRKGTKDYFHVDLNNDGGKESYFSVIQPGDHVLGMTDAQIKTASVIGRFLRKFQAYQFHDTTPEARIRQSTEPHLNLFLGNNGGNLAGWLHRLFHMKNSQSYSMIESTVRHAFPDFGGFDLIEDPLNGKTQFLWHHRHHEGLFRATHLSDGTIRFIALCALFLQPIEFIPDVLLIDEPELGLHPTALLILASMARNVVAQGKQVILTTQSPKLLSQFDPKNVVVVERENEASTFKSVSDMGIPLEEWLEKYDGLGSLWEMNLLGGTP